MVERRKYAIHICGVPDGPYRYGGFYFEVHPYLGPCLLKPNGEPKESEPPAKFWKAWDVFSKLPQHARDCYAAAA